MRLTLRRVHKWMGVLVGLVFLLWVVSGIVMILPSPPAPGLASVPPPDYPASTLSPSQAVALVAKWEGNSRPVTAVTLERLGNRSVYLVKVKGRRSYLVDATSGERVVMTPELAATIAREAFADKAEVREVARLEQHGVGYPAGPLPVYRVAFDDRRNTVAFVSHQDGQVRIMDWRHRVRAVIGSLHTFQPVELVTGSDTFRLTLLHLFSLFAVVLIVTGYSLSLSDRWQSRPPD